MVDSKLLKTTGVPVVDQGKQCVHKKKNNNKNFLLRVELNIS